KGTWEWKGADLIGRGGEGDDNAVLELPYRPGDEYDFIIDFTRTQGDLALGFAMGRQNKSLEWATCIEGIRTGFHLIDDDHLLAIPASIRPDITFVNGTKHTIRFEVRKTGVTAILDGKKVDELRTDYSNVALPAPVDVFRGKSPLGLTIAANLTVA